MTERKFQSASSAEETKYFHALGVFIESFALAEVGVFHLLVSHTGLDYPKAKAIMSGAKVDQCIQYIRRIWAVEPPADSVRTMLEESFLHFLAINDMRNRIVHNASRVYEIDGRTVSNETRALTEDKIKEDKINPEVLLQMAKDCSKINASFGLLLASEETSLKCAKICAAPWQYELPAGQSRDKKDSAKHP